MMKVKKSYSNRNGFTLIELMLVVAILSVLASIITPRIDLLLQKAGQATAKNNLGSIRSALALYYADLEGVYPYQGYGNGYGNSLSLALCPKYMEKLPTPNLYDRQDNFNGLAEKYDPTAAAYMRLTPPDDIYTFTPMSGAMMGVDKPFIYDPSRGLMVYNNINNDSMGNSFDSW